MNRNLSCCHRVRGCIAAMLAIAWAVPAAHAKVNLEWRPDFQTVNVGDTVNVGLYAVSDSAQNQDFTLLQLVFSWDAASLAFIGLDDTGGLPPAANPFRDVSNNCPGFNENDPAPPSDGNGLYTWKALPGQSAAATPAGTLITTFRFSAMIGTTSMAQVQMLDVVDAGCKTKFFNGLANALGQLDTARIQIDCVSAAQCPGGSICDVPNNTCLVDCNSNATPDAWEPAGDFDANGTIDLGDYIRFSDCFTTGPCPGGACPFPLYADPCCVVADADQDGAVDLRDYGAFTKVFDGGP